MQILYRDASGPGWVDKSDPYLNLDNKIVWIHNTGKSRQWSFGFQIKLPAFRMLSTNINILVLCKKDKCTVQNIPVMERTS
jgi:hypothetical protein